MDADHTKETYRESLAIEPDNPAVVDVGGLVNARASQPRRMQGAGYEPGSGERLRHRCRHYLCQ
jgi:hypothetical protein